MLDEDQKATLREIFARWRRFRTIHDTEINQLEAIINQLERENHDLTQAIRRLSVEDTTN